MSSTGDMLNEEGSTRGERKHLLSVQAGEAGEEELENVGEVMIQQNENRQGFQ